MTLLLIFVSAAFALTAVYLAIAPFLESLEAQARAELIDDELKQVEQLVASRSVLLQSLRDLEFEYETDKISKDDYERFRTSLERQAVGVMRELDRIHGGRGWEEKIDEEIALRLGEEFDDVVDEMAEEHADDQTESGDETSDPSTASRPLQVDLEEADIEAAGSSADFADGEETASELKCAECGAALEPDDRFCSKCGTPARSSTPAKEATG